MLIIWLATGLRCSNRVYYIYIKNYKCWSLWEKKFSSFLWIKQLYTRAVRKVISGCSLCRKEWVRLVGANVLYRWAQKVALSCDSSKILKYQSFVSCRNKNLPKCEVLAVYTVFTFKFELCTLEQLSSVMKKWPIKHAWKREGLLATSSQCLTWMSVLPLLNERTQSCRLQLLCS